MAAEAGPAAIGDAGAAAEDADAELQRVLRESIEDWAGAGGDRGTASEEADLERALRESAEGAKEDFGVRRLMGADGPFFPAGLANSGNSCFWNALLQALFAATPIFRGALFGLAFEEAGGDGRGDTPDDNATQVLGLLRDLFADMDMGLVEAIDAGELYRKVFQRSEEADVSEQMQRLFELLASGPGALKAVFKELFSGDLYEHLREGKVRRVPLDFCQLDLCVTQPTSLEYMLEELTRDVLGSIERRSYRLPPVLWLNLDRFVYDREAQRGRKLQVPLTFPELLNVWMLVPPEAPWLGRIRDCARRCQELQEALGTNREVVARYTAERLDLPPDREQALLGLVERQEALAEELRQAQEAMARLGAEQEILYQLQAVIVHSGHVDTGHYFAYARSPSTTNPGWCCLNDAHVTVVSSDEMRRVCEGGDSKEAGGQELPTASAPQEAGSGDAASRLPAATTASVSATPPPRPEVSPPPEPNGEEATATAAAPRRPTGLSPSVGTKPQRPAPQKGGVWSSMTSMFGCLQAPAVSEPSDTVSVRMDGAEPPAPTVLSRSSKRSEEVVVPGASVVAPAAAGSAPVGQPAPVAGAEVPGAPANAGDTEVASAAAAPSQPPPPAEGAAPPPQSRSVTAARCLVYVRSGTAGDRLLTEVKRRVPRALQERIDGRNAELLRKSINAVAEDFALCVHRLSANLVPGTSCETPGERQAGRRHVDVDEVLRAAERVRTDGGMGKARLYLLRECWRQHVPWLPEDLCPTATPPDFRMYYGASAKRMLLDALIERGQHDVASLVVAETEGTDSFIPAQFQQWLQTRGL